MPLIEEDDNPSTRPRSAWPPSPSPSTRSHTSQIAKTYRQAAHLFKTHRFLEALSTLEPIITPQRTKETWTTHKGNDDEDDKEDLNLPESAAALLAPIAYAAKSSRIKVWVFWVTFLNSVVDMGPEEGKAVFGTPKWKELAAIASEGTIWRDVVQYGYGGVVGNVEAVVVVNLIILLLERAHSQQFTKQCLESYLAAIANPSIDLTAHLTSPLRHFKNTTPDANTTRDLETNITLLELYTLHILPRNGQWDQAREFIIGSHMLDEEKKDGFLQALHELKLENEQIAASERGEEGQQWEGERLREKEAEEESRKKATRRLKAKPTAPRKSGNLRLETSNQKDHEQIPSRIPQNENENEKKSILERFNVNKMMQAVKGLARSTTTLRTIMFIVALLYVLGKREIRLRLRLQRALRTGWNKLGATIGMGLKVSSI